MGFTEFVDFGAHPNGPVSTTTGAHNKADLVANEPNGNGGSNYTQGASIGNGQFNWGYSNLVNMAVPKDFALGDFTGDNRADIVAYEGNSYMQGASLGNGQFTWGFSNLNGMAAPKQVELGDVNGDNKADIVADEPTANGGVNFMEGISQGNGRFSWIWTNLVNMATPKKFALGDVNNDGKADIIDFEPNGSGGGQYREGISQGAGQFSWIDTNLVNMAEPTTFAVGDINGDGKADTVAAEPSSDGGVNYMEGTSQGAGKFSWGYTSLTHMTPPTEIALGDITGDGRADLVAFEPNGNGSGKYMQGASLGNGQFSRGYSNLNGMAVPNTFNLGDINGS